MEYVYYVYMNFNSRYIYKKQIIILLVFLIYLIKIDDFIIHIEVIDIRYYI